MSYQLRGFMGPDSLVNIFSLRRIEKKKKKKTWTTSNLREGFYEARELDDHEYFIGNSRMNEWMNKWINEWMN